MGLKGSLTPIITVSALISTNKLSDVSLDTTVPDDSRFPFDFPDSSYYSECIMMDV